MKRKSIAVLTCLFLMIALTVHAAAVPAYTGHVTDEAGLLTGEELGELEILAKQITQKHRIGVYILTVSDMEDYGYYDPFDFGRDYFLEAGLGVSGEDNGLLLVLSMQERDYALLAHGDEANAVFSDSAQRDLEDAFLPELGDNNWYGGFYDYLIQADICLSLESAGTSVAPDGYRPDESNDSGAPGLLVRVGLPVGVAGVICALLLIPMNNARRKTTAGEYIPSGGVNIRFRQDRYLHTTRTRTKVQSSSSGSSARSGGGFSGRSGKF